MCLEANTPQLIKGSGRGFSKGNHLNISVQQEGFWCWLAVEAFAGFWLKATQDK
jgi:hypothetical protein